MRRLSRIALARGGGSSSDAHVGGRPAPLSPHGVPALVGVVTQDDGERVVVEQVAELGACGVEHLVEVERGGERLGDLVQLVEQRVGVGQATDLVEGRGLALLGLAGDPPGVAGDERDEQDLHGPLHRRCGRRRRRRSGSRAQGMLTAMIDATAMRRPNPNPRANPATATAVSIEKASGDSQ